MISPLTPQYSPQYSPVIPRLKPSGPRNLACHASSQLSKTITGRCTQRPIPAIIRNYSGSKCMEIKVSYVQARRFIDFHTLILNSYHYFTKSSRFTRSNTSNAPPRVALKIFTWCLMACSFKRVYAFSEPSRKYFS